MDRLLAALEALKAEHGIEYALDAFPTQTDDYTPPAPPFITYSIGTTTHIYADNTQYITMRDISVTLYTEYKDPAIEALVDSALLQAGLLFTREDEDLPDDKLYSVVYDLNI